MSTEFSGVKAGDVLYEVRNERMGRTAMRRLCWYRVYIVSVDHAKWEAVVHWNVMFNPAETWSARRISRLRRSIPKKLAESQGIDIKP